jgi:glutamyl-tRNA(Gln) amidotransferase subunit E
VIIVDYKKLGLRVGLEIHQQINSGAKLFCRCPITRSEQMPIEIRRKLRAVPGELGDVDPAALQEFLRNRTFVYRANHESSCLVEIDEQPPLMMNEKALRTALQMCKLLHCHILDEIHVMRKTVVDGSAVSGFQRTALVGIGGYVEGAFGRIGIQTLMLEEDAATPVTKGAGYVEYRLDRLGIPLIEIATDSSINSPQMAKDVAEHIGLLLRSADVVRGIGSIRQDINVSIEQGARIEIKGFQELDKIPDVVQNEINRQVSLIEIRDELKKRGFREIKSTPVDVTRIFDNTKSNFIRKIIDSHGFVFALVLPKFSGLLKKMCGDRTFGKELSAYAESYGLGIIHSDEQLEKYSLAMEFQMVKAELKAGTEDLVLISAGHDKVALANALTLIVSRANNCIRGVPEETRVADGLGSRYTRPLPGSGRLYPESDVPPVRITKELRAIETPKTLMEKQEETVSELTKRGMKESVARSVVTLRNVSSEEIKTVEEFSKKFPKVDPNLIARMVVEMPKEIKARFRIDTAGLGREIYFRLLTSLNKQEVSGDAVLFILVDHLTGKNIDEAIAKYKIITDVELRRIIKNVVAANKGKKESVLMGLVMEKVRGRASGEKVSKILKEMI